MKKLLAMAVLASAVLAAAGPARGEGWGFGIEFGDEGGGGTVRFGQPWDHEDRRGDCNRDEEERAPDPGRCTGDGDRPRSPWVDPPPASGPFPGGDEFAKPEDSWIPVSDPPPHSCHCQGGRLLIVIGDDTDSTIDAALKWAMFHYERDLHIVERRVDGRTEHEIEVRPHLHILRYSTNHRGPDMTRPQIGEASIRRMVRNVRGEAERYLKAVPEWSRRREVPKAAQTGLLPPDCCHFDEVMIMFHGHQNGVYEGLIEYLPYVLNGKPARRVVIWSCRSGERFFPKQAATDPVGPYERLLGVFRPKNCPCGCDPTRCRALDANGADSRCPTDRDPVTVLTAGYYVNPNDPNRTPVPVNLGINFEAYENPEARTLDGTLSSPDGRLRQITVHPDGSITAEMTSVGADGYGIPTFGGIRVGTDRNYPSVPRRPRPNAPDLMRASQVDAVPDPPYSGSPRTCAVRDGCFPDGAPTASTTR